MELSSLSEEKLIILLQVMNNFDEINYSFMNNYQNKIRIFREGHIKSLYDVEELKRVQESRVDESSRRRLIENQDTISELTARIQELQNEVNCLNGSRDFKDAESVRSGLSHVPSQPALLPPFRDPGGMLSRKDKPPDIWDTHGLSGNVFVNPLASSSSPYLGGFNPWIPDVTDHVSWHVTSERQMPDTSSGSEMPVRTVSQKFSHLQWRRLFKELWGRPTTTAEFGSSF